MADAEGPHGGVAAKEPNILGEQPRPAPAASLKNLSFLRIGKIATEPSQAQYES